MANNGKSNTVMRYRRRNSRNNAFDNYPFLRYVLPLACGIAFGYAASDLLLSHEPKILTCTAVCAALLCVLAFFRRRSVEYVWFGIVLNAFFFFSGVFSSVHAVAGVRHVWSDSPQTYCGIIEDQPNVYNKVIRMRVRLVSSYEDGCIRPCNRTVELAAMRSSAIDTLKTGNGVMFFAKVSTPRNPGNPYEPDYASNLLRAGVSGTAFAFKGKTAPLSDAQTNHIIQTELHISERIFLRAKLIRDHLQNIYAQSEISGENLAVLSALTLGDKHLLTRSTRELFSATGVSHVLALSGLHLGILYGILQFIFTAGGFARRMRIPAQVAIIFFIWLYAAMAGMPSSLIRASIMYTLVSIAIIARRSAVTLNNLFAAAFIMLLFNPMSLMDIGFQLSFLSVFFILVFVRRLQPPASLRNKFVRRLWEMIAVSLCAQIGVAPLVAYYFNQFPTYFIFSNLIVVPMAFLLVAGGLVYLTFSWFAPLAAVASVALKFMLSFMLNALQAISELPCSSLPLFPSAYTVAIVYVAFFFAAVYYSRRSVALLVACTACTIAATAYETACNLKERDVAGVYFYKGLSCPVVHFVVSPDESYIYVPPQYSDSAVAASIAGVARTFWHRCRIATPVRLTEHFVSPAVERNGCMVQYGRQRFCLLDSSTARNAHPSHTRADVAYVMRGFKGEPTIWLNAVRPATAILDENLPQRLRTKLEAACTAARIGCYDMLVRDALKIQAQ